MSVWRSVDGKPAALTRWLDDLLVVDGEALDEEIRAKKRIRVPDPLRFSRQIQIMHVFDELIQNVDRNQGNLMWDRTWKLWMVDRTRAFRLGRDLNKPEALGLCERGLLDGLRRLTADALARAVGPNLTRPEADAVMARRDLLVKHYEARIAAHGEGAVLFTLAQAAALPAPPRVPVNGSGVARVPCPTRRRRRQPGSTFRPRQLTVAAPAADLAATAAASAATSLAPLKATSP
jgi:hypothetical protein